MRLHKQARFLACPALFDCYRLLSLISAHMTLMPGDIILTGTPGGVAPLQSGDRLEVRIHGLSLLINNVK